MEGEIDRRVRVVVDAMLRSPLLARDNSTHPDCPAYPLLMVDDTGETSALLPPRYVHVR